ncbi:SURF1 family protein [Aestuariimicrobium ganziense]|uniref:SURF1 family protein n=1 Tax=Aestuariimicrobium ganziense TaxID=2773677 RepID=UPI00194433E2|nr:SURF1 family protein [Aestuariimicrobium ganziense]
MSVRFKRVAVVSAGTIVCLAMMVLGLWQMDVFRNQGRQSAEEITKLPPVPLVEHLNDTDASTVFGRQVTLTGSFIPDEQFHAGEAYPLRVVTAFKLDSGQVVAVVRGQRGLSDEVTPAASGPVTVTGVLLPSENDRARGGIPAQDLPGDTIAKIRLAHVAQYWPGPLVNGYVTLSEADAKSQGLQPAPVVLPELEGRARNGGYALQWWVFAAAALAFSIVVARSIKE